MRHRGFISGRELDAEGDFIVYGPSFGLVGECESFAAAEAALEEKLAELKQFNVASDLAVFRWSDGNWAPAISPYDIQEREIQKNPSRMIHFP